MPVPAPRGIKLHRRRRIADLLNATLGQPIGDIVKRLASCLTLILLATPAGLLAQSSSSNFYPSPSPAQVGASPVSNAAANGSPAPFSRLAFSGGIGSMGINMQAAVNADRYLNIRGIGNYFSYTVSNVTINNSGGSNGISVGGNLKFATAGVAADLYPFPNHGFRLSPGVVFYNQNQATATGIAAGGTSFTFGSQKYYSDDTDPLNLAARLGLNTRKTAFSMTTGWGNLISRRGGHWSFPFEIGAVFTGAPTIAFNATGFGCYDQAQTECVNLATDPTAQANIAAQVAKYQKDLNDVPVYPIFSFGVGYNFKIR
jgi:hypothetical protein